MEFAKWANFLRNWLKTKNNKFNLKNISFNPNPNNPNDMEPIQGNDTPYDYDNEDAIKPYNFSGNDQ